MESSYSIDTVARLVRMQVGGELTVDGLIDIMNRVGSDPSYRPGMHAIADFRESRGNWDYSQIQRYRDYVMHIAGTRRRCRWAAVVGPGALAGVAHVVIVISQAVGISLNMQLFDDPQSALRWVRGERN